eukprot:1837137-Pyramimonas_sp.AAC.1
MQAAIWAKTWPAQAAPLLRRAPVCFYADNMDVLRVYAGGYAQVALRPIKSLLDGLIQAMRMRVIAIADEHMRGHIAHPCNVCVDALARLAATRTAPAHAELP